MPDEIVAELEHVCFAWDSRAAFRLDIGSLRVRRGERILLTGPSGSGKSTLLALMCGATIAGAGKVMVLGENYADMASGQCDRFRAEHIGIVFQTLNLIPYLSIIENVTLPLCFAPNRRARVISEGGPEAEAQRLLGRLGLDCKALAFQATAQLSVGQQQRVAAARALIGCPDIILADEPTSALDPDRQDAFLALICDEARRANSTLLMVSHELRFSGKFDRVIRMQDIARLPGVAA